MENNFYQCSKGHHNIFYAIFNTGQKELNSCQREHRVARLARIFPGENFYVYDTTSPALTAAYGIACTRTYYYKHAYAAHTHGQSA